MGIQRAFLSATVAAILLVIGVQAASVSPAEFAPLEATPVDSSTAVSEAGAPRASNARKVARSREVLEGLQRSYVHLEGVSVRFGATPNGEQAVAYYSEGDIVISPAHTASVEKILAHEVWHIIDWRDDGELDWGENLPPANSSDYLRR